MLLRDRCILVVGGAGGLGTGIATVCLREGATCMLADINEKALLAAVEALGPEAFATRCDTTSPASIEHLVSATVERLGRIDGLVNSAGINFGKSFADTMSAEWHQVIDTNLGSVFSLMQPVCRQMLAQPRPGGSIVNIASVHAHATTSGSAAYSAAKAGLLGLTRAFAVEFAGNLIRANTISPGLCDTALWHTLLHQSKDKAACEASWLANIPLGRLIAPEEIGELAAFLLSDRSSAITGSDYVIDGGILASLLTGVSSE